jgi:hypothetical protein
MTRRSNRSYSFTWRSPASACVGGRRQGLMWVPGPTTAFMVSEHRGPSGHEIFAFRASEERSFWTRTASRDPKAFSEPNPAPFRARNCVLREPALRRHDIGTAALTDPHRLFAFPNASYGTRTARPAGSRNGVLSATQLLCRAPGQRERGFGLLRHGF